MLYIKYKHKESIRKMFTKFNLYIGLNDKDTKQQEILTTDAYKIVGDRTITEGKGLYTHTDGTRVLETMLFVQIIDFSGDLDIGPIVELLKTALNQEAIAVIREQVDSKLM